MSIVHSEDFMTHVNSKHGMNFLGPYFNATRGYHAYLHEELDHDHEHSRDELYFEDSSEPNSFR